MTTKVHFLGIGGSGTSAAAAIAKAQGFEISGCDIEPHTEFTTIFDDKELLTGHNPKHLEGIDILAVTPAIFSLDPKNPELLAAKEKGIPVMTWQQFTGEYLAKEKFVIAVCGTHGKTTTTAMIAELLEDAGLDPTVELGGIIPRWKTNFRIGKGKYFVVEADEFNDNFLAHKPDITVVTNIEMDHPEYFKDFEAVKESFYKFLLQTKNSVFVNLLDPVVSELVKHLMKRHTSLQEESIARIFVDRLKYVQCLDYSKHELGLKLKIPGSFNKLNSQAAFEVGLILGIDTHIIKQSLENYTGVSRRFEYLGDFNPSASSGQAGAKIYSDFGHHPTEIKATMEAAREKFPDRRIMMIYQPHMFSRTKNLFNDFVKVFKDLPVDKIFITDIYPSREVDTGMVNSKELSDAIKKDSVEYGGEIKNILEKIKPEIKPNDIVFFMGAGDIDKKAKKLIS